MTTPIMPKTDAAELINAARIRQGLTWATIAEKIDAPLVWTVAALLGKHPVPATKATAVVELLGLGEGALAGVAAVVGGEKSGQGIPKNVVTDGPVVTKANAAGMQWMQDHFLI